MHEIAQNDRKQPITLQEVAARAGVSAGTVSRVLNGKNKENRPAIASRSDEIRKLAVELGYKPNTAARSMSHGRFLAAGFVTCGDYQSDWYPISGLNGIHTAVEKMGWRLLFNELTAEQIRDPEIVPQLFRESAVDGLIVNLLPFFSRVVDYFDKQPLPCVLLNVKRPVRCVYPNEFSGAEAAVNWLLKKGHRRIEFFSRAFGSSPHYSAIDRLEGFRRAMKSANLESQRHTELPSAADEGRLTGLERAERFLDRFPDLQAAVCYELEESVCLATASERRGNRVPDKMEIIGFSERDIRGNTGLQIATNLIPFYEMGQVAVKMLRGMIENGRPELPSVAIPYGSIAG